MINLVFFYQFSTPANTTTSNPSCFYSQVNPTALCHQHRYSNTLVFPAGNMVTIRYLVARCRVPAPVCKHTFAHTRRYDLHGSPTFYAAAGWVLSGFSTSVRRGPDLWGHFAKFCAPWTKMLAKRFFLKIMSARTLLRGIFIGELRTFIYPPPLNPRG